MYLTTYTTNLKHLGREENTTAAPTGSVNKSVDSRYLIDLIQYKSRTQNTLKICNIYSNHKTLTKCGKRRHL